MEDGVLALEHMEIAGFPHVDLHYLGRDQVVISGRLEHVPPVADTL